MTEFKLWHCLPPETQKMLIKAGWKPVREKPVVINIDTAMEDTEEIGRIIRRKPEHLKRNGRW